MENINNLSIKNIKEDSQILFNSFLNGENKRLNLYFDNLLKIKNTFNEKYTYELYQNEFSFYWNKLEINYFFKTGKMLKTPEFIKAQPSLWISYWKKLLKKQLKSKDDYSIRNTSFDTIKEYSDKLSLIFNKIFLNKKETYYIYLNNQEEINTYYEIKSKKQFDEVFTLFIYTLSGTIFFEKNVEESKINEEISFILKNFFDEKLDKNDLFFSKYIPYEIRKSTELSTEYINNRVNYFSFTQNDLKFIDFLNNTFGIDLVLQSISDMVKLDKTNIDKTILKQFFYYELKNEIPDKENTQNNKQKI